MGILVFIGVLAILRAVEDANNLAPTKRPVFPTQYEASVTFNMPYIDMVEPVYVHVDTEKGLQRLSYYGETDVYIFNTSGPSYQILPVIRQRKCFKVSDPQPLQHIFPNLSLFEPQHGVFLVEGRPCFTWKFRTKSAEPTDDGLLGEYTFYVDQHTERPVRFHYVGRNGMLGGSHIDEYYIDYTYIREGPVNEEVFTSLPQSMNCSELSNYNGPARFPQQDVRACQLLGLSVCLIITLMAGMSPIDPHFVAGGDRQEARLVPRVRERAREGVRRQERGGPATGNFPPQLAADQHEEPPGTHDHFILN